MESCGLCICPVGITIYDGIGVFEAISDRQYPFRAPILFLFIISRARLQYCLTDVAVGMRNTSYILRELCFSIITAWYSIAHGETVMSPLQASDSQYDHDIKVAGEEWTETSQEET
jgi:hypothetical protein